MKIRKMENDVVLRFIFRGVYYEGVFGVDVNNFKLIEFSFAGKWENGLVFSITILIFYGVFRIQWKFPELRKVK